ncbi:ODA2, partial [Symbiodinium pilosum]
AKPETPETEQEKEKPAPAESSPEAKRSDETGDPKAGSSTTGPDASGQFNIDAPAFVPKIEDIPDIVELLPNHHKSRLRQFYQAYNGSYCTYYVGTLKSFNTRNGYGFLECRQAKADWGVDVFIHKNNVQTPWFLGQPVEFAVQVNTRGQPQAYDCNWLPRLPPQGNKVTPGTVPAVPGAGPYTASSSSSNANATPEQRAPPQPKAPKMSDEPRRLGTLKSFSQTHGYGFVDCAETKAAYNRDVYLDKSQMRENSAWQWGQLLEFSVSFNDRGNPQAQRVNWEPVPLIASSPSSVPAWKRTYNEKTQDQLKRLLKLLHENNPETAIVTAIDLQGGSSSPGSAAQPAPEAPPDADVDYVFFVLDRLENKEEVLKAIKDFVKMLFVLMLSRMLRTQPSMKRVEQLIEWYEAVAQAIQTTSDAVRQHFQDVVKQINTHIQNAAKENDHLQNE